MALKSVVDGIVAINTVGPVLAIDPISGEPLLGEKYGWLSGPPIKPIALRVVSEIAEVFGKTIIGVGGVINGRDAAEFIMCGASGVEVCTAALFKGPGIYGKIAKELEEFMKENGYETIEDFRGIALERERKRSGTPWITDRCTACMICEKGCPAGAITIETKGKGHISEDCTRCGLCLTLCPTRAIETR